MRDDFTEQLGERLRELRRTRALSLESLATASGVSRSMISDVERGARSPTVLVLARLATALGTTVSRLLGEDQPARTILLRHAEQHAIDHPDGWQRRILSPSCPASSSSSSARPSPRAPSSAASPHTPPDPGSTSRSRPAS
ncbi:helix-turn-helix domain-containing protein [Dactylosporangium cerinum]